MGFRVRGRIKLCKGLYVNVGKRGVTSVSAKVGGVTINKNRNGRVKATTKVCRGVSYEATLKQGRATKTKEYSKKQINQKSTPYIQNNVEQARQEVKLTRGTYFTTIILFFMIALGIAIWEEESYVSADHRQQLETNETQREKAEQQSSNEMEDMNNLFKNCAYSLVNIEQTAINNTRKHFSGHYVDLEGEHTHYIVTLQYSGTRDEWANSWLDFGYVNSDRFDSLNGMHSLKTVSGLYGKPSMEIVVVDTNGDIVYNVVNGDWQNIIDSIENWASQDQLNNMLKGGINSRWCRNWEEFVLNK